MNLTTFISILIVVCYTCVNHVEGECFEVIRQYFECQYLKMVKRTNPSTGEIFYERNDKLDQNNLNNSIPAIQNLSRMSFDQGMDFIRRIYLETANCTTEVCNCTKFGKIDKEGSYSLFFGNADIFRQSKSIINGLNTKFKSQLMPFESLRGYLGHNHSHLPTLTKFCVDFEYTWVRLKFFKYANSCYAYNHSVSKSIKIKF